MKGQRRTKQRGRPTQYLLPPRINATAEQLAAAVLSGKVRQVQEEQFPTAFNCEECGREVAHPEILYDDNRCADCTAHR